MYRQGRAESTAARRELQGLIGSTALHAAILLLLSVFFISGQPVGDKLETYAGFTDGEPSPVTTVVDVDEPLAPPVDQQRDLLKSRTVVASEVIPELSADVTPSGVETNEPEAPAGVAAVVAGIQKRVNDAGGRAGEVQFSLSWHNRNDLDLHVIAPGGKRIFYGDRRSSCGGELDVDMNVRPLSDEPVENTRWLRGKAPSGRYTVFVRWYRQHRGGVRTPFELLVRLGEKTEVLEGRLNRWGDMAVYRFRYVRPNIGAARRRVLEAKYEQLQRDEERKATTLLTSATRQKPYDFAMLATIVMRYPHTDAAIEALKKIPGKSVK